MPRPSTATRIARKRALKPKSTQVQKKEAGVLQAGMRPDVQGVDFAEPTPQAVLQMQQLVGNRATSQMVQPKSAHTTGCGCPVCMGGVQRKSAHTAGCGCAACTGGTLQRTALEDAHTAGCGCAQCAPTKSIQRTMTNAVLSAATVQHLRHNGPVVQRHSSAEHMLLGETKPAELAQVANSKVPIENRIHVLEQELTRVCAWHTLGASAITEEMGTKLGLKMVKIGKDNPIWITYGELNAMPDYMPNPKALMERDGKELGKMADYIRYDAQRWIRQQIERVVGEVRKKITPVRYEMVGKTAVPIYSASDQKLLNTLRQIEKRQPTTAPKKTDSGLYFEQGERFSDWSQSAANGLNAIGMPRSMGSSIAGGIETKAMDAQTKSGGNDAKYSNLLGRNACHFAPFSWDRWFKFHDEARTDALKAYHQKDEAQKKELLNTARIKNGYADHFLQDSFAAGHLINKTLIMQWYVEWMETKYAALAHDYLAKVKQGRAQAAAGASQWGKNKQAEWQQGAANSSQWGKNTQAEWEQGAANSSQWGKNTQAEWEQGAANSSQWGKDVQKNWSGWGYGLGNMIGWGARAMGGLAWGGKQAVGLGARAAGGTAWGTKEAVGLGARAAGGTAWGTKEAIGGLARGVGGTGWAANKALQGGAWGSKWLADLFLPGEWDQARQMNTKAQPGLAGMHIYGAKDAKGNFTGPMRQRKPGESSDPQTAEEEKDLAGRMQKSGVQGGDAQYQNYLAFLKKGSLQIATGLLHNKFCREGLEVINSHGAGFKVYGDYNLLNTGEDVVKGVQIAGEAAQASQKAIEDVATLGDSPHTPASIFALFPQKVKHPDGKAVYSLPEWHDGTMPNRLRDYAVKEIFEPMLQFVWNRLETFMDMDEITKQAPQNPHPEQGF